MPHRTTIYIGTSQHPGFDTTIYIYIYISSIEAPSFLFVLCLYSQRMILIRHKTNVHSNHSLGFLPCTYIYVHMDWSTYCLPRPQRMIGELPRIWLDITIHVHKVYIVTLEIHAYVQKIRRDLSLFFISGRSGYGFQFVQELNTAVQDRGYFRIVVSILLGTKTNDVP